VRDYGQAEEGELEEDERGGSMREAAGRRPGRREDRDESIEGGERRKEENVRGGREEEG